MGSSMPQNPFFSIFSAFPTEISRIRGRVALLSDWTAGEDALRRALRTLVIEDNDPPGGLGNC
ncbi:MAG: hypothetical protein EOM20_21920, partial [Spartobacteria bacterium]|nr:hypothetical protein [Spartobacteria bacterium]